MRPLLLASLACVLGCGGLGSHDVEVTITAPAAVSEAVVSSVKTLEIGAGTGAHGSSVMVPLNRPLSRTERVTVHATHDQGTLGVGVLARDAGNTIVALGDGEVMLDGTGPHVLNISLRAATASDGNVVHVTPTSTAMFHDTMITFSADSPVSWSVDEAAGGTIGADGVYTAPSTPGTFHVRASSSAFFGQSASATVQVVDRGIVPYVGTLGGGGYADGPLGVGRLAGIGSMARDGNTLYFTTQDKLVRSLDLATGTLATIAGVLDQPAPVDGTGSGAHFSDMTGIVADGLGHLYVADGNNDAIRKVDIATGKVTTFAGKLGMPGNTDGPPGTAMLGYMGGIAFDGAGTLYFADLNCRIGKVDIATQTVSTLLGRQPGTTGGCTDSDGSGSAAGFTNPPSLVWDGAGHLYASSNSVRRIDIAAASVVTLTTKIYGHLAWDGHQLYVLGGNISQVATDGTVTPLNDARSGGQVYIMGAYAGAFGADGAFYVGSSEVISRVDPATGSVVTVGGVPSTTVGSSMFGERTQTRLAGFTNFTLAPDGTLYGKAGDFFFKVDPGSSKAVMLPWMPNFACCTDMIVDNAGNLYATSADQTVRRISLADGTGSLVAGTSNQYGYVEGVGGAAQFSGVHELALDGAGNLYVADGNNQLIRKIVLATGQTSAFAGTPQMTGFADATGTAAKFYQPSGLVYDGAGALYVGDSSNQRIRKVTVPGAIVTTVAGSGMIGVDDGAALSATFYSPTALALDATKQNLVVSDTLNNLLRRVSLTSGAVSTVAGTAGLSFDQLGPLPGVLNQPSTLRVLPSGDILASTFRECSILQIRLP